MLSYIAKGGVMMYPLLAASVFVLAVIIERFVFFHKAEVDEDALFVKVRDEFRESGSAAAISYCEKVGGPLAVMMKAALERAGVTHELVTITGGPHLFDRDAELDASPVGRVLTGAVDFLSRHLHV